MNGPAPDRRGTPFPVPLYLNAALGAFGVALAHAEKSEAPDIWPADFRARIDEASIRATRQDVAIAGIDRLLAMIKGIETWRAHPYTRHDPDRPVLWQRGNVRLLDCAPQAPSGAPRLLLVPSLINRAYILDLKPGCSFVDWLSDAGLYPVLLDWGDVSGAECGFSLSDYLRLRLLPAAQSLAATGGLSVLGYCLGGTMALALAQEMGPRVQRLGLVGTPWDFSQMSDLTRALIAASRPQMSENLRLLASLPSTSQATIPGAFFQMLFAAIAPMQAARKFRRFAELAPESTEAEHFVAVEEWLSDPVPVAARAGQELLADFYLENAPGNGTWEPAGTPIKPAEISTPTLSLIGARDHIAPAACSATLRHLMPNTASHVIETGHVGLIVGSRAKLEVAAPLATHFGAI